MVLQIFLRNIFKKWTHQPLPEKIKFFSGLIFCLIILSGLLWPVAVLSLEESSQSCELSRSDRHPLMHPDLTTLEKWVRDYQLAPKAAMVSPTQVTRGSLSLLSHLQYTPAQRDQGYCGNCWAWAGTGCLEIALSVSAGVKNRLSVQYLDACYVSDGYACNGGWLDDVVDFYSTTRKAVPWSNTNAAYRYPSGEGIACSLVGTSPNYPITSISSSTITTQGVTQAQAIANIKNALSQGKAIWFGYFLPSDGWNSFFNFWDYQSESVIYNINNYTGTTIAGGHAVLCVGYNDDDPNNSYWVMVNSWGTTSGRPNGIFRVNMNMDYAKTLTSGSSSYFALYWQVLNVQFGGIDPDPSPTPPAPPVLNSVTLADRTSGSTTTTDEQIINITLSASGSPTQMILSENSSFSGASWQTYSAVTTFTLSAGAGVKTVYAKVKNSDGESSARSDSITYSPGQGAPSISTFTLSAADTGSTEAAADRLVNYTITATNTPTQMIISENSKFKKARWQPYATSGTFDLSKKVGNKTVYLKVRNSYGQSAVTRDSIRYDPSINAPVITYFDIFDRTSDDNLYTNERDIIFRVTADKNPTHYIVSENPKFKKGRWIQYATSGTFKLSGKQGVKYVYLKLKNSYGESSREWAYIYYYIWVVDQPAAGVLKFRMKSAGNESELYTNVPTVLLTFEKAPGQEILASEREDFTGASWQPLSNPHRFELSSAEGEKTVFAKFKDVLGKESRTGSARIILDRTPPEVTIKIDDRSVLSGDLTAATFKVKAILAEANEINPESLKFYLDNQLNNFDNFDETTKTAVFELKEKLPDGQHSIKVTAQDMAGNEGSAEIKNLRVASTLTLEQVYNCPNPFNEKTQFTYQLSKDADIEIKIYTVRGELVRTLTAAAGSEGGKAGFNNQLEWNATDEAGRAMANGMYFYLVRARDSEGNQVIKKSKVGVLK